MATDGSQSPLPGLPVKDTLSLHLIGDSTVGRAVPEHILEELLMAFLHQPGLCDSGNKDNSDTVPGLEEAGTSLGLRMPQPTRVSERRAFELGSTGQAGRANT